MVSAMNFVISFVPLLLIFVYFVSFCHHLAADQHWENLAQGSASAGTHWRSGHQNNTHYSPCLPTETCSQHPQGLTSPLSRNPCSCHIRTLTAWRILWLHAFHLGLTEHGENSTSGQSALPSHAILVGYLDTLAAPRYKSGRLPG